MEGTAEVWYEAWCEGKVWEKDLDVPRFRRAFVRFAAADGNTWPQPKTILDLMPTRAECQPQLAAPQGSKRDDVYDIAHMDNLRSVCPQIDDYRKIPADTHDPARAKKYIADLAKYLGVPVDKVFDDKKESQG